MRVKFNRAALQEALVLVTSVVPSRTPKPILQCVKFTAEGDSVRICGTDLEVGITTRVTQVEIEAEGEVVIPADKVTSIIRESVDEVVAFEASEAAVHIKGADSHFTIYGHDAGQYPSVIGFEVGVDFEMNLDKLQAGIEQCLCCRESTRYALTASCGKSAARNSPLSPPMADGSPRAWCTCPPRSRASSPKAASSSRQDDVTAGSRRRRRGGEGWRSLCRQSDRPDMRKRCNRSNLVEGNFKYEDIIPKDYTKKLVLNTSAALRAVRRAALLANEDSKGIRLSLSDNTMIISSRAPETGDAQIDMAVAYTDAPMEIGFNPQFLIDVLRVIRTDEFELHLGEPDRPGLIKKRKRFSLPCHAGEFVANSAGAYEGRMAPSGQG